MIAVNIDNLHCSYGKDPILQEISFSIKTGEFFIIIGPNGSGKTTLLKVINSIIKPQRGSMELLDSPFQSYTRKALARLLALVPQEV
ncbi:MAG: ABC transporter ATP-binding protein, partial [SAR324 cluster bacterium]|nr:ABC transporter ATP-binding protein [SAR324 cluster bacterium]